MKKLKNITKEFYFNMSFNSAWAYTSRLQGKTKGQAADIEMFSFDLELALAEIEKLKDSIRALESEQKDYEKTTMRLREENKSQATEIEELKEVIDKMHDRIVELAGRVPFIVSFGR